eukprot:g42046.t1
MSVTKLVWASHSSSRAGDTVGVSSCGSRAQKGRPTAAGSARVSGERVALAEHEVRRATRPELPLQISFGEEIKTEYTWLQEHTRTRKRGRVQQYKFNAKQGRQVRNKVVKAPSTDGANEMGTHCSFANGSAKAFGAFAVKLRDNGDIHHVQALFVNKDDQVVLATILLSQEPSLKNFFLRSSNKSCTSNYPAVARTITEKFFPSKFKPEELSNLSSNINRSLSAWVQDLCSKTLSMERPLKCLRVSKAPVCKPETLKPARVRRAKGRKPGATVSQEHHDQSAFEGAHASPAIQEHATAADLTKVLEKVTKNTVRDVIKEIKPLFKLGTVKKTKNAKQDDGAINKIRDKLDQQAKSLDAAAAAINKFTDKLNNTHEKSDLESGSASENSSEDEKDFEKRCCNFCAVPSSYYFGPVALPPISSVPTPISSVPSHQELMHQQMQVSSASVLGQAQVCPSCRSTFQHPTVSQFSYSFTVPLPSYIGGTIYQTPPHPVTHSHAEKKKKKAHSSKRCIAFERQKKIHEVD